MKLYKVVQGKRRLAVLATPEDILEAARELGLLDDQRVTGSADAGGQVPGDQGTEVRQGREF